MKRALFFCGLLAFQTAVLAWFDPPTPLVRVVNLNQFTNAPVVIEVTWPISLFGEFDSAGAGPAFYYLELFSDTDADGFPTVADGSAWRLVQTVSNWTSTVKGLIFRKDVLSTNLVAIGSNYILRVTGQSPLGIWSADTNQLYWSSSGEADAYGWTTDRWSAFKPVCQKPSRPE